MEKMRYEYKSQGSKQSMLELLKCQARMEQFNEHNQETNFKIKEICK